MIIGLIKLEYLKFEEAIETRPKLSFKRGNHGRNETNNITSVSHIITRCGNVIVTAKGPIFLRTLLLITMRLPFWTEV